MEFADSGLSSSGGGAPQVVLDELFGPLGDDIAHRYAAFMDLIERMTKPPGHLHDVGCGNGQLLVEAQRRGWTVQGNDLVESVKAPLEARGISCFIGELAALDLSPSSCDVVVSLCVLPHHSADPLPDLKAIARLLRPGGRFVAQLPSDGPYRRVAWALYRISGGRLEMPLANIYQPHGHVFGYTPATIRLVLRRCGFDNVTIMPYDHSTSISTARFATRGRAFRAVVTAGVKALSVMGRFSGLPNHIVVSATVLLPQDANA